MTADADRVNALVSHLRLSAQRAQTIALHAHDVANPANGLRRNTPIQLLNWWDGSPGIRATPTRILSDARTVLNALQDLRRRNLPPELALAALEPLTAIYPEAPQ